jgi:hypothetical protein
MPTPNTMPLSNVMPGGAGPVLPIAGVPSVGTDEVQTVTIGGTPTGGSFTLTLEGYTTAAIPWNATNATLLASIDAALEALPNVGTGGVTVAAGTLTAGIGTLTCTFDTGNRARSPLLGVMTATNAMTGTAPTIAVARTTPGVGASFRGVGTGIIVTDITNKKAYINTGTANVPVWTVLGSQT